MTTCVIEMPDGAPIQIMTFHMVPFQFFNVGLNEERARIALSEIEYCVVTNAGNRSIVQADFNIDSPTLREYLPDLFATGFNEILQTESTTPSGKVLDHILYRELEIGKVNTVTDCQTDHFPIVTNFRYC